MGLISVYQQYGSYFRSVDQRIITAKASVRAEVREPAVSIRQTCDVSCLQSSSSGVSREVTEIGEGGGCKRCEDAKRRKGGRGAVREK